MFYCFIVTAAWLVWHIGFRIRVIGRENLPKEGGFVLAPNHISAIDPVFVVIARFWQATAHHGQGGDPAGEPGVHLDVPPRGRGGH